MKIDNVLLGLIRMHPSISGYQLKAIINDSTGYFFQAHLSQIYPRLKQMAEEKKLVFELVPQKGKPDQKLYSITNKGIECLDEWLKKPPSFEKQRSSFDNYILKFIFMGHLDNHIIVKYLDEGITYFSEELAILKQDNLRVEKAFIETTHQSNEEKHVELWAGVMGYLYDEHDLRIEWLKKMRKAYLS